MTQALPDQQQMRRAFNHAAKQYEQAASLQKQVGDELLKNIMLHCETPHTVIDIGAGTGRLSAELGKHFAKARIIDIDIAINMLRQAKKRSELNQQRFVCSDAQALGLQSELADLVYSNLTFQWCNDLIATFKECYRILKPNGQLHFTSLCEKTLHELRLSWQQIDNYTHVNNFHHHHHIVSALKQAGFCDIQVQTKLIRETHSTLNELMQSLKKIGAHNVTQKRPRGLTGKNKLQQLAENYRHYLTEDGLPASYDVIFISARKL